MLEEVEAMVRAFPLQVLDEKCTKHRLPCAGIGVEPVEADVALRIEPSLKGISIEEPLARPFSPYILIAAEIIVWPSAKPRRL